LESACHFLGLDLDIHTRTPIQRTIRMRTPTTDIDTTVLVTAALGTLIRTTGLTAIGFIIGIAITCTEIHGWRPEGEAKKLGVQVTTLDAEAKRLRKLGNDPNPALQGCPVYLPNIKLWKEGR
jgi:hypothetical protein